MKKQLFYGFAAVAAVATPVIAVVSCGKKTEAATEANPQKVLAEATAQFEAFKTYAEADNHETVVPAVGSITFDKLQEMTEHKMPTLPKGVTATYEVKSVTDTTAVIEVTLTAGKETPVKKEFTITKLVSADQFAVDSVTEAEVIAAIKAAQPASGAADAWHAPTTVNVTKNGKTVVITITNPTPDTTSGVVSISWTAAIGAAHLKDAHQNTHIDGFDSSLSPAEKLAAVKAEIAKTADHPTSIAVVGHDTDLPSEALTKDNHSNGTFTELTAKWGNSILGATATYVATANDAAGTITVVVSYSVATVAEKATATVTLTGFTTTAAKATAQAEADRKQAFAAYSAAYDHAHGLTKTALEQGATAPTLAEPTLEAKLADTATKAEIDTAKAKVDKYVAELPAYNTAVEAANTAASNAAAATALANAKTAAIAKLVKSASAGALETAAYNTAKAAINAATDATALDGIVTAQNALIAAEKVKDDAAQSAAANAAAATALADAKTAAIAKLVKSPSSGSLETAAYNAAKAAINAATDATALDGIVTTQNALIAAEKTKDDAAKAATALADAKTAAIAKLAKSATPGPLESAAITAAEAAINAATDISALDGIVTTQNALIADELAKDTANPAAPADSASLEELYALA